MPRRTSLDVTKWKELESKKLNSIPTLLELCVEKLSENCDVGEEFTKIPLKNRKLMTKQLLISKKLSRETLEVFSSSADIPACVTLDLSNSNITDFGLYLLSGISTLIRISLHNCRNITNRGLYYLKCMLNCKRKYI